MAGSREGFVSGRRRSLRERPIRISGTKESGNVFTSSTPRKLKEVVFGQATSTPPTPIVSASDSVSGISSSRCDTTVKNLQTESTQCETESSSPELPLQDLRILVRFICRVAGTITAKALAEYIPGIDPETASKIFAGLIKAYHLREEKTGRYSFIDPTGEIETGQLQRELGVLADLKRKIIARASTGSSAGASPLQDGKSHSTGEVESRQKNGTPSARRDPDAVDRSNELSNGGQFEFTREIRPCILSATEAAPTSQPAGACEALEALCESLNLRPPAYSITYMPQDRVYHCLVFVGGSSFPSHPDVVITEGAAKEVAARRALEGSGVTPEMVATRNFANARFPLKQIQ